MKKNIKDKIYELKITDDMEDESGIDSISLVDTPAIEINWVAFSKEKEHSFHIPDGEDETYLEKLLPYGQDEQELLDEGYEIDSIQYVKEEEFIYSNPNESSDLDTNLFRIRYKYMLNPKANGQPIIPTTRDFCKELIKKNLVFRLEDMLNQQNDEGGSFADWRGGYNCRHIFGKIIYKKKGIIKNKAGGKREDGLDILGDTQNDTRTSNPSFSKQQMESHSDYPDSVKNNAKRGIELNEKNGNKCATQVGKVRAQQLANGEPISEETIKRMYSYLSRAMAYYDEGNNEACGTISVLLWGGKSALSWAESKVKSFSKKEFQECPEATQDVAINLENRQECIDVANYGPLNPNEANEEYWKKKADMFEGDVASAKKALCGNCAFFVQTKKMLDCIAGGINDTNEWDTIDAGDLGYCEAFDFKCAASRTCDAWVVGGPIVNEDMGYDNSLPAYVDELPKKKKDYIEEDKVKCEKCGHSWDMQDGGEKPYMCNKCGNDNSSQKQNMSKQYFQTDDEKRTIVGPAMVPDMNILRKDIFGNTYYVFFSRDTISQISEKYMRNKYLDNNDLMHDGKAVNDVYVVESWIIEDSETDKSKKYGFSLPVGTWMIAMKCAKTPKGDEVWEQIKSKKLQGFSVSGFFVEQAAFAAEELFLQQVAEILRNIKE